MKGEKLGRTRSFFRWPSAHVIVEADGAAWHDEKVAREDDAERQALPEAHGERVIRVTSAEAVIRPAQTLTRIRAAGAPQSTKGELLGLRPS